jgi:hypothetical protein
MHPKIKSRPSTGNGPANIVEPIVAHEIANLAASAKAASRRTIAPIQPPSGAANHARHHVSRHTQS